MSKVKPKGIMSWVEADIDCMKRDLAPDYGLEFLTPFFESYKQLGERIAKVTTMEQAREFNISEQKKLESFLNKDHKYVIIVDERYYCVLDKHNKLIYEEISEEESALLKLPRIRFICSYDLMDTGFFIFYEFNSFKGILTYHNITFDYIPPDTVDVKIAKEACKIKMHMYKTLKKLWSNVFSKSESERVKVLSVFCTEIIANKWIYLVN